MRAPSPTPAAAACKAALLHRPARVLYSLSSAAASLFRRAGKMCCPRPSSMYEEPLDDLEPSPGPFQIHDRCLVRRLKHGTYTDWAPAEVINICTLRPDLEAKGEFLYEVHWFRDAGRAQMIGRFSLLRGEITFAPEARGGPEGRRKRSGLKLRSRRPAAGLAKRSASFGPSEKVLVQISPEQGQYTWVPAFVLHRHTKETRIAYDIRIAAGRLRGLETRYAGPTFFYHPVNVDMLREKGHVVVTDEVGANGRYEVGANGRYDVHPDPGVGWG